MLFCREIKGSVVSIDDAQDFCAKAGSAGLTSQGICTGHSGGACSRSFYYAGSHGRR